MPCIKIETNVALDAATAKAKALKLANEAATAIGQAKAIPASDSRGKETFFDGVVFDPENPKAYLESQKIKALA